MNPIDIIDKYYTPGTKLYNTLIQHSTCVRDRALYHASLHPELNIDIDFVAEAAMLHDIGVIYCHAPGIYCEGTQPYICHGVIGAELLRKEGFPIHALVCERHTGTGLTLEDIIKRDLPIPHQDFQPVSLEEQIICFADKFYSKARLQDEDSVEKVREKLRRHGGSVEKFDEWVKLFG
ncbi:MAG: HDIG domain-containing protein [Bacteroidales bacterium]|nr:HDIG domain-containing protein [Bacteroidales bacterium]